MKTCTIFGDLLSDSAADNYPVVQICDRCAKANEAREEKAQIVSAEKYDSSFGDTCEFCDKTYAEELEENK